MLYQWGLEWVPRIRLNVRVKVLKIEIAENYGKYNGELGHFGRTNAAASWARRRFPVVKPHHWANRQKRWGGTTPRRPSCHYTGQHTNPTFANLGSQGVTQLTVILSPIFFNLKVLTQNFINEDLTIDHFAPKLNTKFKPKNLSEPKKFVSQNVG